MPRHASHDVAIIRAFARAPGYHTVRRVADAIGISTETTGSAVGRLLHTGELVYLGPSGADIVRGKPVKLYGVPGASVSNPIAVAASRTVEFRPLKRDLFEHWRLAMMTRR